MVSSIPRGQKVALDTMIFIYHLEDYPRYSDITENLFYEIESGRYSAVTSYITLLELLVKPKRERRFRVVSDYKDLLLTFPNLEFISLDLQVADMASSIRAKYSLNTPDSIQIATAITGKASVFITNDEDMRKVKEISVLMLDDWK
ncbi:MAG: type II toxin-antitoxin system VapC family toxin [Candidatus Marinimicrobia bacterium]|nr:type II toxin-antitoxin system VapC family toxin [Candidatus Neomarinimicrobiota bacterium]